MTRATLFDGTSDWSDARVAELKRVLALGWSRSQIAKHLGGVSRNAVIGKAQRMRLDMPGSASAPQRLVRAARPTPKPRAAKPAPKPAPPKPVPVNPPSAHVTSYVAPGQEPAPRVSATAWLPLPGQTPAPFGEPWVCKWPIELPGDPEFYCCGAKRDPSESYCESHRIRAGGPGKPLKERAHDFSRARMRRAA